MTRFLIYVVMAVVLAAGPRIWADPDAPPPSRPPGPDTNRKDEPRARHYSPANALGFLDHAAVDWGQKKNCFSCHTNYAYLYARPLIAAKTPAHDAVRLALEELVTQRWKEKGPRWDAEVVTAAAALAHHDAATTGKLHPVTRTALDRIWTVQRADGGIDWIHCGWPPMEIDDHYGVTLAALAVGVAPEDYAKTEQAQKGLKGLRAYLQAKPPQNLHHRAMLLWASSYLDGFMTPAEKSACVKDLRALQRPDGGWAAASLGNWKRADKLEQDLQTSDGYGTGFTLYVLRRAGVKSDDPALQKGITWLKTNQRESGRWFTRSLNRDNKHYLTHAGTAFAVMALAACSEK